MTVASNVTWMPFGPLKGLTYGNGLDLALSYDQDYRLAALSTAAGATTIQSLSYGYDSVGNITSITDSVNAARSQTYDYDNLYRLTSATGVYGNFGYSYDAVGNRLTRTRSGGAGALSETYSYAANSNRLLSVANGSTTRNFSYSAAGNISLDDRGVGQDYGLVYSNDNRLAELTQASQSKATYANSDSGERVRKTLPGSPATTTHYLYDRNGVLIDEGDGTGTAQREYIHLAGLPLALIAGSQLAFVHMDHLGTPQAMTDGTQAQVWDVALRPFGTAETQTGTLLNPQRFPGQLADDEAGYHDNVWRTYDPSLGRYLQSDPIGLRGGLNTFAYVGGNPIGRLDRFGLETEIAIWNGVGSGQSAFGHVSTNINGENFSYGPGGWDKTYPSAEDYNRRQQGFRGGRGYQLGLSPDQELRLRACLLNSNQPYSALSRNCGDPIQECLKQVGAGLPNRSMFPENLGKALQLSPQLSGTNSYPSGRPISTDSFGESP